MVVLNEAEIRDAVFLSRAVVYEMGMAFQSGEVGFSCQPPVQQMVLDPLNGLLCVKSFYSIDQAHFVVKMAGNYRPDGGSVSQTHGMNALYDSTSGRLQAVLADNGYLTQIRTAAAGGYAVDLLAPEHINVAVIVGTGRQARMQLTALLLMRSPIEIRCLGRSTESLKDFADWANETHQVDLQCYQDEGAALTEADLVITATTSSTPVLHREALLGEDKHRDRLVIAMGSDSVGKREIEETLVLESDRWVCDDISQSLSLGELKGISEHRVYEVIKPIPLEKVGRGAIKGLTICDLTGVAKLDLAISEYCLARVLASSSSPNPTSSPN